MPDSVADRVRSVQERLAAACARANRDPAGVRIVAVAKTFGPEAIAEALACGLRVFGESRVQEAGHKIPLCPGDAEWHMVGHLQRNKAKDAVSLFRMIHSVDSLRLLEAIDRAAEAQGVMMPVCIEVNVSGEGSKFGVAPEATRELIEQANRFMRASVVGLMTIPPFSREAEDARPFFRRLRELRDSLRAATGTALDELSMGMSDDFEAAVAEGATWVRLGTALFGPRRSPWRPAGTETGDA
ncbi:MAG: YggS family pyridoxal phosphate-dependent enzyme [Verrucomicrobiota bacterium]|nr:YggS family pyridoxal phosphate-dependent enzyme [Verrucomicrobiota bacterium]